MSNIMQFEFDPEKSRANKAKHSIDFVDSSTVVER